jgi:hypothetical protein
MFSSLAGAPYSRLSFTVANNTNNGILFTTQTSSLSPPNGYFEIRQGTETSFLVQRSTGNVGIGTTTPSEKLTVIGNISASGNIFSNGNQVATVVDPVRTTLTGNGILSTFNIGGASGIVNPSALIVAIDGALQEPVADYTVTGGQITFTSPLANGSKAVVISPTNTLQVSQMIPADGTVTSSKLDTNIEIAGSLRVLNQTLLDNNQVMTERMYAEKLMTEINTVGLLCPASHNTTNANGGASSVIGSRVFSSTSNISNAGPNYANVLGRDQSAGGQTLANTNFGLGFTLIHNMNIEAQAQQVFGVGLPEVMPAYGLPFLTGTGVGFAMVNPTQFVLFCHDGSSYTQTAPYPFVHYRTTGLILTSNGSGRVRLFLSQTDRGKIELNPVLEIPTGGPTLGNYANNGNIRGRIINGTVASTNVLYVLRSSFMFDPTFS